MADASYKSHPHGPHRHVEAGHAVGGEHAQDQVHRGLSRQRLLVSMALTGAMMIVEFVGGILSGSLALVSDAGHMFTHFFALGLSYAAIRIATAPAEGEKSYGLYRAEILAALVNGLFLAGVSLYIAYESVLRLLAPEPIATGEMLVVAAAGLAVNLVTAGLLWSAGRDDINVKSAFYHMLADTLSSVAVVAGAMVIMLTGFLRVDPILGLVITVLIAVWSWQLLVRSVRILLEATPPGLNLDALEIALQEADGRVRSVHDIHVWEITSDMLAMTAIVAVDPTITMEEATQLQQRLREVAHDGFAIGHAIFQVEATKG